MGLDKAAPLKGSDAMSSPSQAYRGGSAPFAAFAEAKLSVVAAARSLNSSTAE